MKRFACLNLCSVGLSIACLDALIAVCILSLSSYHLFYDFMDLTQWQQADVQIMSPFGTFVATLGNKIYKFTSIRLTFLIFKWTMCWCMNSPRLSI